MRKRIEYKKGDKIGNLTFLNDEPDREYGRSFSRVANFKCHCGNNFITNISSVKNGDTTSCGCIYLASRKTIRYVHGHTVNGQSSIEFNSWLSMKQRCCNPNNEYYFDYGGRGIKICEEWLNSFETFFKDMGIGPSKNHTLDRIENDKGYFKENCRWATKSTQSNNRRNNIKISINGTEKNLKEWCIELGLNYKNVHKRIHHFGWPIEQAFLKQHFKGSRYYKSRILVKS